MPGSWELREQNKVLVGILHTENVPIAWAFGLRNLIIPGQIMPTAGMPFDMARNSICKAALDNGYQYVFMLDSDVIPPRDTILRLLAHNQPFISGMYCRRSPPHGVPVAIKNGSWLTNFTPGDIVEVDLVGSGCLLIRRDFLEKIPPQRPQAGKHWFDWRVDTQNVLPPEQLAIQPPLSEDFTLCHHARNYGYKVLLDTGIQCRHVGLAQSTLGQFLPCESTPIT